MNLSRLTIRARITGGSLLIAILLSIAACAVIYDQVRRIVGEGHVRTLQGIEGQYLTAIGAGDTAALDQPGPGQFVAVVAPDASMPLDTLPAGLKGETAGLSAAPDGVQSIDTPSTTFLVKVTTVDAAGGAWRVITAIDDDDGVLHGVGILLVASIGVITLGFSAATWLIATAALQPVTQLRLSAAELVATPSEELLPVGAARDEISELATALNELIRQLRSSAERERQIVSDASHEFRTPLAIIRARLELAQRQAGSLDEMRDDVAAAQKTLERLSSLAASLLELSRIDAQAEPGQATVARLAEELADAADRGRLRVGGRDIRVEYTDDIGDDAAVGVAVGEADFGRVCDNLVNNALTAIGDASGTVTLRLERAGDVLRLTVADDGGGMSAEFAPHALDRFARQSESRTRGGAGLGLPIVAGVAAVSGGSVTLDNRPGRGLTVAVTFPLQP